MNKPTRRIVTAYDADGRSVFRSDEPLQGRPIPTGDTEFARIWTTAEVPAELADETDGALRDAGTTLNGGSVIRVVDMRPGCSSPMHRSLSIDHGIVLSGQLELDGGELRLLHPGDIVVQRGTNHLWRNPSNSEWCRIVFILIEATPYDFKS